MMNTNQGMSAFFIAAILLLLASVAVSVILYIKSAADKKKRRALEKKFAELEERYTGLKNQAVESTLNPHLFKNILNSIQSHAYQTYFSLDKLAGVLDYILYESRNGLVTPREEISFALNLVEIHKIKVSPLFELKVKTTLSEQEPLFDQKLVVPMITVDLIENAFKHADLQSPDAFISIVFEYNDHCLALTVANKISSRPPLRKEKGGIGTDTLEHRLNVNYRDCYKLDRFVENGVYVAYLKINLLEYKSKMSAAG